MTSAQYVITCTAPDGETLYWVQEDIASDIAEFAARFDLQPTAGIIAIRAYLRDGRNWQAVMLEPRRYACLPMVISALISVLVVAVIISALIRII